MNDKKSKLILRGTDCRDYLQYVNNKAEIDRLVNCKKYYKKTRLLAKEYKELLDNGSMDDVSGKVSTAEIDKAYRNQFESTLEWLIEKMRDAT